MSPKRKKNPYLKTFYLLAIICVLTLCTIFFTFNYLNVKKIQTNYYQEKVKLIAEDFERQLQLFERISLKISISNIYDPNYVTSKKINEYLLLQDFKQYSNQSVLADDFFLCYQGKQIFLSSGYSSPIEYYFKDMLPENQLQLINSLSDNSTEKEVLSIGETLYFVYPLSIISEGETCIPKLSFVVKKGFLVNRIYTISGISDIAISISHSGNNILISHDSLPTGKGFYSQTGEGLFEICLYPLNESLFSLYTTMPLQIALIVFNLVLIVFATYLLAEYTYLPIKKISKIYRQKVLSSPIELQYKDALEELNYLMDKMLQDNILLNKDTIEKQKQLHRQILRTLLFNNFAPNEWPSLDSVQIELPGPLYYVISISFLSDSDITDEKLTHLQERLESLTDKEQREYLYCICNNIQKQLILVCSIAFKEQNRHLTDRILLILEKDSINPIIGVGNIHDSLSRISASWLESTEIIHRQITSKADNVTIHTENHDITNDFAAVINKLTTEREDIALQEFHNFMNRFKTDNISFLMQQYKFYNIISELSRLANRSKIEISDTSMSLLISAKNTQNFQSAGEIWIHEFYQQKRLLQEQIESDENFRILDYINKHFTDGDLSIEKVASMLNTTTTIVRQAILAHTGMMYRDYVIYLRIEYAKDLLTRENFTINEVCEMVGYFNVSHFTQLFKKHTGTTPASYKKNPSLYL